MAKPATDTRQSEAPPMDQARLEELGTELEGLVAELRARAERDGDARTADGLGLEAFTKLNERIDATERQMRELVKARRSPAAGDREIGDAAQREAHEAVMTYLRRGEQRLTTSQHEALERQQRALSVDSDPDGGYLVTPAMSARISEIVFETSPVRQVATVETIGTDALEGLFDGEEAGADWVGERGARPQTDTPKLGMWRIPTHELYAAPRATQKLLDDANVDIEAWLNRKVAERFARRENTAFVLGTGVNQPRGFMTYPAGTAARGQIEQLPSLAAGAIEPEAVWNMVYRIKPTYRQGATWAMNRATLGAIRTLRDDAGGAGTGQFMWAPGFGTTPSSLAGYPIAEFEDMASISAGNLVAAFGSFRQAYTIVDRVGVRVLRDPYTAKPYVEFYTTKRVGGDVINFEAIKILKIAAS